MIARFDLTAMDIESQTDAARTAEQQDTAVLTAYRGHGLGRCHKAAMMR